MSHTALNQQLLNTQSSDQIMGVYWCRRNIQLPTNSGRHFIAIIYANQHQAEQLTLRCNTTFFTTTNQANTEIFCTSISADKEKDNPDVTMIFNSGLDQKALQEICHPTDGNTIEFPSLQGSFIPYEYSLKNLLSTEVFMVSVLNCAFNFNTRLKGGDGVSHNDENDYAYIFNSLFKSLGFTEQDRFKLGELNNDTAHIPLYYFQDTYYIGNCNTRELHEPNCRWLEKMEKSSQVRFFNIRDAKRQGYDGCYFCLKKHSTR